MCSKNINNLFLLGAGFTKAVFPDAPLNKCLLQAVMNYSPSSPLQKYCREYKTDDIEVLLTRLDLEILNNQTPKNDREIIENDLAEYFRRFRFGASEKEILQKKWLESFAKELFRENDAIITINYDCLLEGVLDYYKVWSPSKGYGAADVKVDVPGTYFEKLPNPKNILVYKIHGSENFQTCNIQNIHIDPNHIGLIVNSNIYPKSGANSNLGVIESRSYIIAPSFVKTFYPQIQRMMIRALQAAGKAKNFIIIGCGLRPEDSFFWLLLSAFLESCIPEKPQKKFIIVDPNAKEIKNKIAKQYMWINDDLIKPIDKQIEFAVKELIGTLNSTN